MNKDIRERIRKTRVKHWEVAKALGVSESTLVRWLRAELPEERKAEILEAIEKVVRET